jgi:GTP-binding protein EngB required for normal cell division
MDSDHPQALNEAQQRHLLASLQYVDKLLCEIESVLTAAQSKSAFPKYRLDLTPAQARVVSDYIARLRAQMLRALRSLGIEPPEPQLGALHSIRVTLGFADIALEECRPKRMKGYGPMPADRAAELEGMVDELQSLVARLDAYLAQGSAQDLAARLERLERSGLDVAMVRTLEGIIHRWGLVEFRPALAAILDGLETRSFEIAVFGRVSAGKSSLLNYVLGTDVLPVGVTPITAVPTRILYGPTPRGRVWFVGSGPEEFPPERLREFVSEEHNPGNRRNVTRLVIELPAPRLRNGVVFVDTPGLGSLATAGAAETRAYLPRCDLAVVLVDAGSTLTAEDLALIQALYENAIPVHVLLSKADLLNEADRERMTAYIAEHVRNELGLDLAVHAVSVKPGHSHLLETWFEREIVPLCERAQELGQRSLARKIAKLKESVRAALEARAQHAARTGAGAEALAEVETALRVASGRFEQVRVACFRVTDGVRGLAREVLRRAAVALADGGDRPAREIVVAALEQVAAEQARVLTGLLEDLARDAARTLREAEAALAMQCNVPAEAELLGSLSELPRLDPGGIPAPEMPGRWIRLLGGAAARWILQRRLQRQLEAPVASALAGYGRALEAWTRRKLAELESHFDSCAEIFRAQFERLESRAGADAGELAELKRDLAALETGPHEAIASR